MDTVLEVFIGSKEKHIGLNLPITGLNSRGTYTFVTLSTVSVKVVIELAKVFSEHTYQQIKDTPLDQPQRLVEELIALNRDPDANFLPAIWWIYRLLKEDWVERFKLDGHKIDGHDNLSDFMLHILLEHPDDFLRAITQLNNEELSKGRSFYMFPLKQDESPVLKPAFALPMQEVNEYGVQHSKNNGCGKHFVATPFETEDMIGLRIERSSYRKNSPKVDAAEVARAVTQRDIREDIVLLHIPSQTLWVSCPPPEKNFCLSLIGLAITGAAGKFGPQRKFKTDFLKEEDLEGVLASSIVGIARAVSLKQVLFVKKGAQPKNEVFKVSTKKRPDTLASEGYEEFHRVRKLYSGAKSIKLQVELLEEQRLFDTILINEDKVEFGKHLDEGYTLAILYKLKVLERYTNA